MENTVYTKDDIRRLVKEEDIKFVRLQFVDILGSLKNVAITSDQLEKALNNEIVFDGSSITGFIRSKESDMYLIPDLNTFKIFPWRPSNGKVARLICDISMADESPYTWDPRFVLKKAIKEAKDMGYNLKLAPEFEFFLFYTDDNGHPTTTTHDEAGYFDLGPIDLGENVRRDMVLTLEDMGFEIQASHHEVSPGQHEIDFETIDALNAADSIVTFKLVVKVIAQKHGLHATFMPKPIYGKNGSGMHCNISLYNEKQENVFFDSEDENKLSQTAKYFIGGLLKHAKAMTAITNPTVNSYKRLVEGYEAPTYIGWSKIISSPFIRIPNINHNDAKIELRNPDSSCNPYLTLAVILSAGLDGIKNKITPPDIVTSEKLSQLTKTIYSDLRLPGNLKEAILELSKDEVIKDTLGDLCESYIKAKTLEWEEYS